MNVDPCFANLSILDYRKEEAETIKKRFVALDFETTGLNAEKDRVIEIGAVLFEDGREKERFDSLVNPERMLMPVIVDITGITQRMLDAAPTEDEVLPSFLSFLGNAVRGETFLVAHNARFDGSFLRNMLRRHQLSCDLRMYDTLRIAKSTLRELENYKQDTVAHHFGIVNERAHRASTDARTCGRIFLALMGQNA